MDRFLENYWNLDQIRGWAETRDPEIVRAAAWPQFGRPKKSAEIAIRVTHSATAVLRDGRDVDGELWTASGWPVETKKFEPPPIVQRYADKHEIPVYQAYLYKNLQVRWPFNPRPAKLDQAWKFASETDRARLVAITVDHFEDNAAILADERVDELEPNLAEILRQTLSSPLVQGPPHVFFREPFPTIDYMTHLFQEDRLQALGNKPNEAEAVIISKLNWSGLEIGVGGEYQRLGVWLRGKISTIGHGEFENVRVFRDDVLRDFPAEQPGVHDPEPEAVTDNEIREMIRAACQGNGGFIGQNAGADIVRQHFPSVTRDRARELIKQVTGNAKPGPKGPRFRRSA